MTLNPQKDPQKTLLYDHPSDLEPMLVLTPALEEKSVELIRSSAALSGQLHPSVRKTIAERIRWMNGYYSNLIEEIRTKPVDIEDAVYGALNQELEPERKKSILFLRAHYEAEEAYYDAQPKNIYSLKFAQTVHKKLFRYSLTQDQTVVPGQLRTHQVAVGRHLAPDHKSIPALMNRFEEVYTTATAQKNPIGAVLQTLAAHHRFLFIHPFSDGNGRVGRLLLHAGLERTGLGGGGLWTIDRGLARHRQRYFEMLNRADSKRDSDFDGRGPRSQKALQEFCDTLLNIAIDQVRFMSGLLELPSLISRVNEYSLRKEGTKELPAGTQRIVHAVLTGGQISRGEVPSLIGKSERTAQHVISRLLIVGMLQSPSPKGKLAFAIPIHAASSYFPELYPAGSIPIREIPEREHIQKLLDRLRNVPEI
jgi:Fic family protein